MNKYFIYKFEYNKHIKVGNNNPSTSCTVIFCNQLEINREEIKDEIRSFYESHYQTDQIVVIGGEYLQDQMIRVFINEQDQTFIGIPKRQDIHLNENLFLASFDSVGILKEFGKNKGLDQGFYGSYLNEGLQKIFKDRGGLIVTHGTHHFVFPSGKHCDKFLRTGNILLHSCEISFIAFSLLKHFKNDYDRIYCDTSSINSVAYSLIELKNRFRKKTLQIPIDSFGSYEGLYKNPNTYTPNDFLLISASTSANIITYILDHHEMIDRENIVVLYFLGPKGKYSNIKDKVLCNLTKSKNNPNGIDYYSTHKAEDCVFCRRGSYPVEVSGDVFLLEKPHINRVVISVVDAQRNLPKLVEQFKATDKNNAILKCSYKESSSSFSSDRKYEAYIDFKTIIDGLGADLKRFRKYKLRLDDYVSQHIPSNTRYLLSLDDEGSRGLTEYVLNNIKPNYSKAKIPKTYGIKDVSRIDDEPGTIVVIGSCISNGKNLLYISRALRKFEKLRILYFIGIARTHNSEHLHFLKSNLAYGKYGPETNGFICVETLFCNNNSKDTSWIKELDFLKEFITYLKDNNLDDEDVIKFLQQRQLVLTNGMGKSERGLANGLFYPRLGKNKNIELRIRKGFAFLRFSVENLSQSDIYFTISNVINSLRHNENEERNLRQSTYVRNVIDPGNFNRYNDGIIQASILRSAYPDELFYKMDEKLSQDMTDILESIIHFYRHEQGEALLEFLYALAIRKLSLKPPHLDKVLKILEKCDHNLIRYLGHYIKEKVLNEKKKFAPQS